LNFFSPQTNNMSNPGREIKYFFKLKKKKSRTRTFLNRWMVRVRKNERVKIG